MTELVGLAIDELSWEQKRRADGQWVAVRIYDPVSLPLRKIEAVGNSAAEVLGRVAERGEDARRFEAVRLRFLR